MKRLYSQSLFLNITVQSQKSPIATDQFPFQNSSSQKNNWLYLSNAMSSTTIIAANAKLAKSFPTKNWSPQYELTPVPCLAQIICISLSLDIRGRRRKKITAMIAPLTHNLPSLWLSSCSGAGWGFGSWVGFFGVVVSGSWGGSSPVQVCLSWMTLKAESQTYN